MLGLILFLFGLLVGSFLGVVVDRIPKGETIIKGRSYCEFCKKELSLPDLIPVFSFVLLKGRCRYCHKKLSLYYPIIEFGTGILFVLTYVFIISNFKFQISNELLNQDFLIPNEIFNHQSIIINLIYYLFIVSSFIVIFFTDLKYGIIPDKIIFPAIVISIFYFLVFNSLSLIPHLISGLGAFLFFLAISYIFYFFTKKQSMGGGDIKLSFLLGLFLGFPKIIVSLYLAFLTGGVLSIILILWKKKAFSKDSLPFGPFLIFAAILSFFFGNIIYSRFLVFLGM